MGHYPRSFVRRDDTTRKDDSSFSLATFNVRYGTAPDGDNSWEKRRAVFAHCVTGLHADILAVQEALPFQLDEIKQVLPHMTRFGLGRFHSVHTDRVHEAYSGEHCDIFYDPSIFGLRDWGTFWHSSTPDTPASADWGNSLPRITTWGLLSRHSGDRPFVVFNSHLHWDEPYVSNTTNLLVERFRSIAGHLPYVVTGDFNATPDTPVYRLISQELKLTDAWTECGGDEDGAGTTHRFEGIPRRRIDWILNSPGVSVSRTARVRYEESGRYPSDHYPVVSVLSV